MPKTTEYDSIASAYSRSNVERGDRIFIFPPTAKHYLGDLSQKDILDLACGDGFFSRFFKEWGANKVVGVDISPKMVKIALDKEGEQKQGIEYFVANVVEMENIGEFDLVFAGFLLHYAPTIEQLNAMAKKISAHLKRGGRFVSFNENPFHPLHKGIKYDVESIATLPITDRTEVKKTHYKNGKKDFEFSHFHYEPDTYENALTLAGFKKIQWNPFIKTIEADQGRPRNYWDDYLNNFSIAVLTCIKN